MAGDAQGIKAGRAYVELGANRGPFEKALNDAARKLRSWGAAIGGIGASITTPAYRALPINRASCCPEGALFNLAETACATAWAQSETRKAEAELFAAVVPADRSLLAERRAALKRTAEAVRSLAAPGKSWQAGPGCVFRGVT